MKKSKKKKNKLDKGIIIGSFVLVIVVLLFVSVCVDMISIYGSNQPVFAIFDKEKNVYKGLFYNTYICPAYSAPKVKPKWSNYKCREVTFTKNNLIVVDSNNSEKITKEKIINEDLDNEYYVFYYGLSKATINLNGEKWDLIDAIYNKVISFDEIYKRIYNSETFKDGGSTFYSDGFIKYNKNGTIKEQKVGSYKILQCNTINGNKDVYIGDLNMKFKSNFCKNKNFIRTYRIVSIEESNDEEFVYLTLRAFQEEEVETVKVKKEIVKDVVEDKYYEFKFEFIDDKKVENNIKSIFENSNLIKVLETSKEGLDQRNDSLDR